MPGRYLEQGIHRAGLVQHRPPLTRVPRADLLTVFSREVRDADELPAGVEVWGSTLGGGVTGYVHGMVVTDVPDLALLDNEARRDAYRTQAKVWDIDAHPSFRPMVAKLVEQYKTDRPELFTDEHR